MLVTLVSFTTREHGHKNGPSRGPKNFHHGFCGQNTCPVTGSSAACGAARRFNGVSVFMQTQQVNSDVFLWRVGTCVGDGHPFCYLMFPPS